MDSPTTSHRTTFLNRWRLGLSGVFLLGWLAYLPALWGKLVWEDTNLIEGHATGGLTLGGAFSHPFLNSYYRPLTSVSFWLDRHLTGIRVFFFHETNISLHAASAVLVCWLTLLLTRQKPAAILAGIFFALQPAQVGAVAWIGGRTDVLSTFFNLLFLG